MNRIYERVQATTAIVPVSQSAAGNTTSGYIDCSDISEIQFVVQFGALAATKKLTIDLYCADDTSATNAEKDDTVVVTSPTGGLTSGEAVVSAMIIPGRRRYYAVKVTNDAASAVLISAAALLVTNRTPAAPENLLKV